MRRQQNEEKQSGTSNIDCLDIDMNTQQRISLVRDEYDPRDYYFDHVLNVNSDQNETYEQVARPVVQDVLDGFNGVVMAYGQTGSGKTHTIFGSKPEQYGPESP